MTVLAIKQRYPGHARQAALIASQCRSGAYLGRYVIVVDDDIDITNTEEVIWAISSAPSRWIPSKFCAAAGAVRSTRASRLAKRVSTRAPSSTPRDPMNGATSFPSPAVIAGS